MGGPAAQPRGVAMATKKVTIDSECVKARSGWHIWFAHTHDTTWTRLGCVCSRCGCQCLTDYETYRAYMDLRNGYYNLAYGPGGDGDAT